VLSLVFLAVLVVPVLDETWPAGWRTTFALTDTVVWVAFAAEYLIRLALVPRPGRFLVRTIPDLIVIVVPVLRALRTARFARLVRFVVMFVGAVGMLDVERHSAGGNIRTFGDAVWWALTTRQRSVMAIDTPSYVRNGQSGVRNPSTGIGTAPKAPESAIHNGPDRPVISERSPAPGPARPRKEITVGQGTSHVAEPAVGAPGITAQRREGRVHAQLPADGEHTHRLLDDHPAVHRRLQRIRPQPGCGGRRPPRTRLCGTWPPEAASRSTEKGAEALAPAHRRC
jgi:hypothetical protein